MGALQDLHEILDDLTENLNDICGIHVVIIVVILAVVVAYCWHLPIKGYQE